MVKFLTVSLFVTAVIVLASANGDHWFSWTICIGHKAGDYIIDSKDPHYYWECVGQEVAYKFKCPANLIFNPNKNVCDYDPNVDKAPVTADPSVPHSKTFNCTGKNDGSYADEHDRHKFHKCSKGFATDFTCPPTTVFVPSKNVCDHENVF